jgi:hypothetical protein
MAPKKKKKEDSISCEECCGDSNGYVQADKSSCKYLMQDAIDSLTGQATSPSLALAALCELAQAFRQMLLVTGLPRQSSAFVAQRVLIKLGECVLQSSSVHQLQLKVNMQQEEALERYRIGSAGPSAMMPLLLLPPPLPPPPPLLLLHPPPPPPPPLLLLPPPLSPPPPPTATAPGTKRQRRRERERQKKALITP